MTKADFTPWTEFHDQPEACMQFMLNKLLWKKPEDYDKLFEIFKAGKLYYKITPELVNPGESVSKIYALTACDIQNSESDDDLLIVQITLRDMSNEDVNGMFLDSSILMTEFIEIPTCEACQSQDVELSRQHMEITDLSMMGYKQFIPESFYTKKCNDCDHESEHGVPPTIVDKIISYCHGFDISQLSELSNSLDDIIRAKEAEMCEHIILKHGVCQHCNKKFHVTLEPDHEDERYDEYE